MRFDTLAHARDLFRRPSFTPADAGAMDLLQRTLEGLGYNCRRMRFGEIENLYARLGTNGPNHCYAGHPDEVPPGDYAAWSADPFAAEIKHGGLVGRGAVDLKGSIAAWTGAVARVLASGGVKGS